MVPGIVLLKSIVGPNHQVHGWYLWWMMDWMSMFYKLFNH